MTVGMATGSRTGSDFSFTTAYPDFDIKAVTDYGRKKGVTLIGHHETSANAEHYESQLDDAFKLYKSMGVDSVKTGYVSDAGGFRAVQPDGKIAYGWHEGQAAVRHHMKVVETAAKYHIAVNPHEPVKDTGLRRTYPNWSVAKASAAWNITHGANQKIRPIMKAY